MKQKPISQIIKENYSSLSPGQKKVAEFINQNKDEGALLTAFQMGRKVDVSETTVIRLAYALGFKGYSEMQEVVRKDWLTKRQIEADEGFPSQTDELDENHVFLNVIEKEKSVFQQLLQQLDTDEVWRAVDRLIQADRVYIGGFGSSYGAAYWLYFTLKQYRGNVFLSSPLGFSLEDISELNHDSVVIIFSFPRYRKEAIELAKCSQKLGANIVAITNRQLSPIGQLAEITLTTEENMHAGHHSIASVVCLLEVIISGVQHRDRDRISLRQKQLEQLYTEQGLFLE